MRKQKWNRKKITVHKIETRKKENKVDLGTE